MPGLRLCSCSELFNIKSGVKQGCVSIGNHMISSAIWDKSARVNFSKANKFVVFEKFTSADLSQIAREKLCDYLLIIHIKKILCKGMTNKMCSVAYLSESLLKHYRVAKL